MNVATMTIVVFFTQVVFIFCRTWNVRAVARGDVPGVLVSGSLVHITWLVSITIGVVSMTEIMSDFQWKYVPVIVGSLSGGLLGSYWGMKRKR